jgi:hypothetical protein
MKNKDREVNEIPFEMPKRESFWEFLSLKGESMPG